MKSKKISVNSTIIEVTAILAEKQETIQLGKRDYSEKFDDPSLLGSGKDLLIFKIFRKLLKWAN